DLEHRLALPGEALDHLDVAGDVVAQHLDRDDGAVGTTPGPPHRAHRPRPDARLEDVAAEGPAVRRSVHHPPSLSRTSAFVFRPGEGSPSRPPPRKGWLSGRRS